MDQKTALCDLAFLTKFTKGDTAKIANYINTYLRTSERIFKELEMAAATMNHDDIYVKAHTVKPQVQYMGITSLQENLLKIEELARSASSSEELKGVIEEALSIYARSRNELEGKLVELNATA